MTTVHEITGNADLFRAAYPSWPSPEPLGVITGQGDDPITAQRQEGNGWLRCNRESGHSEVKHLDGRTGREWSGAEILSPAASMPLFAAQPPALPWCSTCQRPHIPLAGSCPEPESCPDCHYVRCIPSCPSRYESPEG